MDPNLPLLAGALARMAPYPLVTGVRAISARDLESLHTGERSVVANAVSSRQNEFASGRALLREMLQTTAPILVGPTRAPLLPAGVVGSLAHDHAVAVAVVCDCAQMIALGIDVEPSEPLSGEVSRMILRDDEAGIDAHLAFTLKEAAYKAWSNWGGSMLEHHQVRLAIDGQRYTATVLPDDRRLVGRFVTIGGRHLAVVAITV